MYLYVDEGGRLVVQSLTPSVCILNILRQDTEIRVKTV